MPWSPAASAWATRSRPPISPGATSCRTTILGEHGVRCGLGLSRVAAADPLAPHGRVCEELRRPVKGLERAVLRAEREGALHAASEPGVTARAVLGRLEEAEHRFDRLEPLALPSDLEQAQPDIRHLRLTGQAAPRRRGRRASGEAPTKAAVGPHRGCDPLCGAGGVADEPHILQHAPTLEQTADAVGDGM